MQTGKGEANKQFCLRNFSKKINKKQQQQKTEAKKKTENKAIWIFGLLK